MSHSVCDAGGLESRGTPTLMLIIGGLDPLANGMARLLGLDLSLVTLKTGLFGLTREQIAEAVRPLDAEILSALTAP